MKKLFLASLFQEVATIFKEFVSEDLRGKTVTFIPTASIVEEVNFYVDAGKKVLEEMGLIIDELEITTSTSKEISSKLCQNDFIYVTGGNTFFLLQELKKKGADKLIVDQINSGKLYIGESAGSMILANDVEYVKEMDDYRIATDIDDYSALKLIDFYPLPHYKNIHFNKIVENIIHIYQSELNLSPFSDSQAILINENDVKIMSN